MDDIVERITAVATAEKMTAEQVFKIVVAYTLHRAEMNKIGLSEYILQQAPTLNGAEISLLSWVVRSKSRPFIESICNSILTAERPYDLILPAMAELDVDDELGKSLLARLGMVRNGRFAQSGAGGTAVSTRPAPTLLRMGDNQLGFSFGGSK